MKNKGLIILLASLSMLGALSTDTYLPSFPSMAREFGVSISVIQQTLTVYLIAMSVMTLFHGTLSDSIGRRPVILGGLAIYFLASAGASLSSNLAVLLSCRLLQGMSAGVGMVVGRAMIRDQFSGPDAQKVMSYTTVVFGLAPVIAPIMGGWLEVFYGWRSVFVFLTLFGLLLLVASVVRLKESLPASNRVPLRLKSTLAGYATLGSDPRFMLQCMATALSSSALFLYISSAPVFVLHILHLTETDFAWLFIPLIAGVMLGSLAASRVAHLWSAQKIINVGFVGMILAAMLNVTYSIFFTASVPWAVVPIGLCTFGMSFVSPAMSVITLDLYPARRGLAASLQATAIMMLFSLYSGVVAPLLFGSAINLALGALAGYVLSTVLWSWSQRLPVPNEEPINP